MTVLIDLPFVALFILLMAIIGGPIAFVPLLAVPIVVMIGMMMQKALKKLMKQSMMESALKNALLFETISGLETIKVQAAEGHTQRSWEELTEKSCADVIENETFKLACDVSHGFCAAIRNGGSCHCGRLYDCQC